jgi:hypothetical protein
VAEARAPIIAIDHQRDRAPGRLLSPDDEHVALGTVDDLGADRPHEQTLERIEPSASYNGQVCVLCRLDDHVAGIALRLDGLGFDPASRQVRLRVLEVAPASLDLGGIEMGPLGDSRARVCLCGCDDDDATVFAGNVVARSSARLAASDPS